MPSTIKRAEPTHQDVMSARAIGRDHPYFSTKLMPDHTRYADLSGSERDYLCLLEIVMCRERQLEAAVALLSDADRERIGV